MAIFKCKMCGGDLEIIEGTNIVECEYCGSKQTVPNMDDEKKLALFNRANRLRFACEFDKAAGIYESIVAEFPEEAEAYWGLVLCKYGIEYVDDPATAKKIPTCHRSSFDSVFDDSNFEQVMENTDTLARSVYRDEAKQIEELRKRIIEVSSKEEPYDIFICYKETADNGDRTIDSVIAQDVYTELVNKGYRVFFSRITLEDKLGQEYEPYIFAALNSAKLMLAFGTTYEYYNAVWVKNEWSRFLQLIASGEKKTLIPCYKDIDAYDMPKEFAKLQAQDMGKVGAIQDLLRGIEKILPRETIKTETVVIQHSASNPTVDSYLERAFMFLEDEKWNSANEYCEKVLDIDPKCAKAYLGKMMADLKVSSESALTVCESPLEENMNYEKILKYADDKLVKKIEEYTLKVEENIKNKEYANAIEKLEKAKTFGEYNEVLEIFEKIKSYKNTEKYLEILNTEIKEHSNRFLKKIETAKKARNLIAVIPYIGMLAVNIDGRILVTSSYIRNQYPEVLNWRDIVAIKANSSKQIVGLKSDGTVVAVGDIEGNQCTMSDWNNIEQIFVEKTLTVAIKNDGTVVCTDKSFDLANWSDIVDIAFKRNDEKYEILGLKKDGTVVCTGDNNPFEGQGDIIAFAHQGSTFALLSNGKFFNPYKVKFANAPYGSREILVSEDIFSIIGDEWGVMILKNSGDIEYCFKDCFSHLVGDYIGEWKKTIALYYDKEVGVGLTSDGNILLRRYKSSVREIRYLDDIEEYAKTLKLFNNIYNYDEERKAAIMEFEKAEKERIEQEKSEQKRIECEMRQQQKLKAERREQNLCQHCGGTFKGLFTKKCSVCGKEKDY